MGFGNINREKPKIGAEQVTKESLLTEKSSICLKCFQAETGKGIPHCCTPASRKANLAELVINEQGVGSEQIIAKVIKNIKENMGDEFRLRQLHGGNDMTISVGKQDMKGQGIVDGLLVAKLKKGLDLSDRDTSKALKILREGNVKVEQNVMDIIHEIGSSSDEEYQNEKIMMEVRS